MDLHPLNRNAEMPLKTNPKAARADPYREGGETCRIFYLISWETQFSRYSKIVQHPPNFSRTERSHADAVGAGLCHDGVEFLR